MRRSSPDANHRTPACSARRTSHSCGAEAQDTKDWCRGKRQRRRPAGRQTSGSGDQGRGRCFALKFHGLLCPEVASENPVDADLKEALELLLALGLGAAVGFERMLRGHTAGIHTHALVALGSCAFVIAGLTLPGNNLAVV